MSLRKLVDAADTLEQMEKVVDAARKLGHANSEAELQAVMLEIAMAIDMLDAPRTNIGTGSAPQSSPRSDTR